MKLEIRNSEAFVGVWTALQQYLDNHNDVEVGVEEQARMDEVQAIVDQFDATMANRLEARSELIFDRVSKLATGSDWSCPTCAGRLASISFAGECTCAKGHLSRLNKQVIIMRGLPGSGKSYAVRQLTRARDLPPAQVATVCSADNFFLTEDGVYKFEPARIGEAHAACLRAFIRATQVDKHDLVIVDNTNIQRWEYENYGLLGYLAGYSVETVCMHQQVITRAEIERSITRNIHGVPAHIIEGMAARWQR